MRIEFIPGEVFPPKYLARNRAINLEKNLPRFGVDDVIRPPLAVVGGAPSVANHVDELRVWDGEIWAINGAHKWCAENGIRSTLYTLDASETLAGVAALAGEGIFADHCHPDVVDAVGTARLVHLDGVPLGCTSAASAPMLAGLNGNRSITLFGCCSSFQGQEHVYQWDAVTDSRVLVECDGREFMTNPPLLMQAEYLADLARQVGAYISVRGDGFLSALIRSGDYSVLKVSQSLLRSVDGAG